MRRRKYSDREADLLTRLKRENDRLKKELGSLRKQLKRIDVDRFQNLKDVIDAGDRREQQATAVEREENLKKEWECWECRRGTLRLVLLEMRNQVKYFRKCDCCDHRTKLQTYSDKVKGVK